MRLHNQVSYAQKILELADRIHAAIPEQPKLLELDNVWHLGELVEIEDLNPTLMQQRYALAHARRRYREEKGLVNAEA